MHAHRTHGESCCHGAESGTGFRHPGFGHHNFKNSPFAGGHPHGFAGHGGSRARRGDVRTAVLRLLSESPMHGYQIIQELSARSGGAWSPSAGSVYPTLQQLADEGLVTAEETAGKKVFSLTDAGTAAVAECAEQPAPWEEAAQSESGTAGYREAVAKLMAAAFQIGKGGSAEQVSAAVEILNDTRKKLYEILAQD